jgi:hypothetical protein
MEAAQAKLWRAVRREVSRASRVGPSNSSSASLSSLVSGEDNDLTAEFIATAHSVNAALARAVAEEVEEQLTDVLMCLGEETTKARILEHALTHFDVEVTCLLREAGYSPENSPPGSRDESPTTADTQTRGSPFTTAPPRTPGDAEGTNRFPKTLRYAHLLPPGAERGSRRDEGVSPDPGLATLRAFVARASLESPNADTNHGEDVVNGVGAIDSIERGVSSGSEKAEEGTSAEVARAKRYVATRPALKPVRVPSASPRSARRCLLPDAGERSSTVPHRDAMANTATAHWGDENPSLEPPSPVETVAEEAGRSRRLVGVALFDPPVWDGSAAAETAERSVHTEKLVTEPEKTVSVSADTGVGTPPEEEGARLGDTKSEGWSTSDEEDKYGYSSFSSSATETSIHEKGGRTANRDVASETPDDDAEAEPSRRLGSARARSRLDVGVGPGPNVVKGYYAGDARRRAARFGVCDAAGATAENAVAAERETRGTESGALDENADDDGETRSIIYARQVEQEKRGAGAGAGAGALKPVAGAAAAFQKFATAMRNAHAGFRRPKLMTTPVWQRHWMEIVESTF